MRGNVDGDAGAPPPHSARVTDSGPRGGPEGRRPSSRAIGGRRPPACPPAAWIFTHDAHLDRRIAAQVAPLRELGFAPVIFAGRGGETRRGFVTVLRPAEAAPAASRLRARVVALARRAGAPLEGLRRAWHRLRAYDSPVAPYADFIRDVYDFTPILARAETALAAGETGRPALVVVNDLPTLPAGRIVAARFGAPLAVDCHEWWAEQARLFMPERPAAAAAADRWERALYPCCAARITVGGALAAAMTAHFGVSFDVIRSACPAPRAPRRADFWPERLGLPAGARVALFQGSLSPMRNLETLAASAARYRDGQFLVVVGDGTERVRMERAARETGACARVRFAGWVDQRELEAWTVNADVGVLPYASVNPYYALSCPNKLFEYLAARLPVVYDPSMLEVARIAGETFGAPADAGTAESLGRATAELLADGGRRAAIAANYEAAGGRFLWHGEARVFKDLIRSIAPPPIC